VIGTIGFGATFVGFLGALFGLATALLVLRGRWPSAPVVRIAMLTAAALVAANVVMVVALVRHDFSISYVAQVGSRATPLLYTVASLWGALEGSILFWAGLLSVVLMLLAVRTRGTDREDLPAALAVLFAVLSFFVFIVLVPGNPWAPVSPVPADGPGPNPLLANHPLMAIHPPLLYLGFVGLSVPFALTVAALLRGKLDDRWLAVTRRWTMIPWVALSAGLVLGAWWSYAVLGWGGYWAWDPVENVALLPWLTATAWLHSAMVSARRGILRGWNVALIVSSFALTILATLVTRSGVLDSVHAFTESPIGPLFLVLFATVAAGSVVLVALRLPRSAPVAAPLGTRGAAFLLNNLLFVAIAATVLFGTLFPLMAEAVANARVSVGAPYFERVIGPLALGLLVLAGIGPTLPWGDWTPEARRRLLPGGLSAAAAAIALLLVDGRPAVIAAGAAAVFVLIQSVALIARRTGAIRGGAIRGSAIRGGRITDRARRSLGGLTAHAGVAVIGLAVLASMAGQTDVTATLRSGESLTLGSDALTFVGLTVSSQGNGRDAITALMHVAGGGGQTPVSPSLTLFTASNATVATPAIVPGALADLYVTLTNVDPTEEAATFRFARYPFVSWLWVGGGILVVGGLLAAWPSRHRSRQSAAERTAPVILDQAPDRI
jgi:cytochrome c-type biogenesis protein CcmF